MKVDTLAQHIEAMHKRLEIVYHNRSSVQPSLEMLPVALMDLGTISEELQVASEELRQQSKALAVAQAEVEAERLHYKELFDFAPYPYLVTDAHGIIQEANHAAAMLLKISQQFLIGQPLIGFVDGEHRIFRDQLNRLRDASRVHDWEVRFSVHGGDPIDVAVTVAAVRDKLGNLVTMRWLLRDITKRLPLATVREGDECNPIQDYPRCVYAKGETISLQPQALWLVCQGLVKLSTLSENGAEVLVGLAGPSMAFGSAITSLPVYQAIAFSKNVELVSLSLTEILACPRLAQTLLPKINQRLRQTESLLAIAGQRRVQERLYHFLLLLQAEFGQAVEEGTRLNVRLTHEDLAQACCTTRVTITRLLNKLQQQGKITFDSKHHIIVKTEVLEVGTAQPQVPVSSLTSSHC